MNAVLALVDPPQPLDTDRFARCLAASRRVRWDIDADVIRGRRFDPDDKFLADGLSRAGELDFLSDAEARYLSRVQARTYANMLGLLERFIGAKLLAISRVHWLADPIAREALVRFGDEERKHQELFRRLEQMMGEHMAEGYCFPWDPNEIARVALGRSTWAVTALTLHVGLLTQSHACQSAPPDNALSPLTRDALTYHWREESQHTILDELEWRRVDAALTRSGRELAVDDFIDLLVVLDGVLQAQAEADAGYFVATLDRRPPPAEACAVRDTILAAYRGQYIRSGLEHPHFHAVLCELATEDQRARIVSALAHLG